MYLPYKRYESIKRIVVDLFETHGINSIPVNEKLLATRLGIELVSYSSLNWKTREALIALAPDGFKWTMVDTNREEHPTIFYNDDPGIALGRQKFTVLHEIGHIVLGHKGESDLAEAEADFFAKYAIAPPALVDLINPSDYLDIARAFGLSKKCAMNSMRYFQQWKQRNQPLSYDHQLTTLFSYKPNGGERMIRKTA